jgi:peptidoglycan/xylan/chitin deacetylase (PgdA/CDA1 family)
LTLIAALLFATAAAAQPPQRAVALTFDDIPGVAFPRADVCDARAVAAWNAKLLATLRAHHAPALGLVVASHSCDGALPLPSILDAWLASGHDLGNHTWSHRDFNRMTLAEYEKDVIRGEAPLRAALARHGRKLVYFRHPLLHTGDTAAKKEGLAAFLRERGYVVAPVTLDNQDWVFANAYARRLDKRVAEAYVPFMESTVAFFEKRTREVVGRDIPQILLLHMNALNADTLDELLRMFERRGYRFITVDEALRDPAYAMRDGYTGPQGLSWIHRWGIGKGMPVVMEPREPNWIGEAAK